MTKPTIDPRRNERPRSLMVMISGAVVLVVVAVLIIMWAAHDSKPTGGDAVPTVVTSDGAIRITKAPKGTEPKAVVSLIEDLQCPVCRNFETTYGDVLTELGQRTDVAVDYHIVGYLDQYSQDDYSTRSANASLCVAEDTARKGDYTIWLNYLTTLFRNQPNEGGPGIANSRLASLAQSVGAGDVSSCIDDLRYGQWIAKNTEALTGKPGFKGTPDIRIDGKQFALPFPPNPDAFKAAVLSAAGA
ncbi:MAG: thioredoxin domain-containing protein [Gordonia sp. (in: high G+C Gram-positive bacteria)]